MLLKKVSLYFNTLKYLRWCQVSYRLRYRFLPIRKGRVGRLQPLVVSKWAFDAPTVLKKSLWSGRHVEFLNKTDAVNSAHDWDDPAADKLWLYNLHYFDDLNASGSEERVDIQKSSILQWIEKNPPIHGNGWEPYPTSLRLVNWIKWCQRNEIYDDVILFSILEQAQALNRQLEFHILGNHLFANAKALCFVGAFFNDKRAEMLLVKGLDILNSQIEEQFLSDGGHFELSPMYHCILLWDLLDLFNLAYSCKNALVTHHKDEWCSTIENALEWMKTMVHPDGDICFFNDSAFGISAAPKQIFNYAALLGFNSNNVLRRTSKCLPDSGYSRLVKGPFTLFFDHAQVGPDYLPGHAHADTLSIELSVGNQRFIVNSGTSEYGSSRERARQRGTDAHNTIVVNKENSSEVWGGFRVARRANVYGYHSWEEDAEVSAEAEHEGYCRIVKGLKHLRRCIVRDSQVLIEDELSASFSSACAYFHLHPDISVKVIDSYTVELTGPAQEKVTFESSSSVIVEGSTWHPEFGKSIPNKRLVIPIQSSFLTTKISVG